MEIPSWVISVVSTGLTALLGFGTKSLWDYIIYKKELNRTRITKLEKIKNLLNESGGLFTMQNKLVRRLAELLKIRLNLTSKDTINGFEALFSQHYDEMTENEKDLHSMVRATTLNSINRVNSEMLTWLQETGDFKANNVKALRDTCGKELAENLSQLELHLNLWQDKYAIWMKNEKHCVVYLDDEEHHGMGFPKQLEAYVDLAIVELKTKKALFKFNRH